MENTINPEVLQFITSVGVSGVLMLWLWDCRAALRDERTAHDRTRNELKEALKDCNRHDDTRRLPVIPEEEKARYRSRLNMGDE